MHQIRHRALILSASNCFGIGCLSKRHGISHVPGLTREWVSMAGWHLTS